MDNKLVFYQAVQEFWLSRDEQMSQQRERGRSDQGFRAAVTGGQQMNGFLNTLSDLMISAGLKSSDIYIGRRMTELPGFFRPTKGWDLVVVRQEHLLAAIELKSHVGPSFGNNFNNRTEEAMGTALDTWTAFREGALRSSLSPFLGYLLMLEDCKESQSEVRVQEPHFRVFPEFQHASYAKRYELFCRKLVLERQYTAACFLLADRARANAERNYVVPADDLSDMQFVAQLLRHVAP
jgi:hypothetical protein